MDSASPAVLTYPSQRAILRWLPIDSRMQLTRKVPALRKVDALLPYRFGSLELDIGSKVNWSTLWFDAVGFHIKKKDHTKVSMKRVPEVGEKPRKVLSFQTRVRLSRVVRRILKFFLHRPGTIVDYVATYDVSALAFRDLKTFPMKKLCWKNYFYPRWTSQQICHALQQIDAPFSILHSAFSTIMISTLVNSIRDTERSVGMDLTIACKEPEVKVFADVLEDVWILNPKRGLQRPHDEFKGIKTSTSFHCIVFQLEHADVVLCSPDYLLEKDDGFSKLVLRIVEKGSVEVFKTEQAPNSTSEASLEPVICLNTKS